MNLNHVIEVEGLSKKFCRSLKRSMAYGAMDVMREIVGLKTKRQDLRPGEFWALQDVSFDLRRGETLGILGLNGSGKSTLLRLISGIFPPDKGKIQIRGKLGSLIALGAGFHPHMTGRENIYLNGTVLGMKREEIDRKLESIIEFSELAGFLDAPIATYSSGMVVRLGFSIAIHSDLDVMLVDEVLSVGDLAFQNKCLRRIYEKKRAGVSFIFVSHAVDTVRMVCDRGLLLSQGRVEQVGEIDDVILAYNRILRGVKAKGLRRERGEDYLVRSDAADFEEIGILSADGQPQERLQFGESFKVYWDFVAKEDLREPTVGIGIKDDRAFNIVYANSQNYKEVHIPELKKGGRYRVEVLFENPNIKPGVYGFNCVICNRKTDEVYLHLLTPPRDGLRIESKERIFEVDGNLHGNNAVVEIPTQWSVTSRDL